jgi:Rrf2 family transcriptional regulator, cysteine metabolism repressor
MKLSTRGRYGTRALLELALNEGKGPVSLKDIAQNQAISLQYLEHLITPLIAGGLIKSTRGAKGGIALAKHAPDIKLSDVLLLLEGSNAPVDCVDKPELCLRANKCAARDVWTDVKRAINGVLETISLQELVERQKRKEQTDEIMYYI